MPEYAGTAAEFYSVGVAEPDDDVTATHDQLVAALAGDPIVALAPAPAQDANTFVVTRTTAERLHVATLSDLAHVDGRLTLGGPSECPARPLCLVGLADVYGLSFDRFLGLDTGGPLTVQALREGHIDVGLLFTTDPILDDPDFVELADDRRLQPAENVTPLIRAELVDRWGAGITDVVDAASARLTTEAVRDLNRELSDDDATVTSVVAAWLAGMTASPATQAGLATPRLAPRRSHATDGAPMTAAPMDPAIGDGGTGVSPPRPCRRPCGARRAVGARPVRRRHCRGTSDGPVGRGSWAWWCSSPGWWWPSSRPRCAGSPIASTLRSCAPWPVCGRSGSCKPPGPSTGSPPGG